ncbi:MAG: 16S rRNA (cytidine(1402)-2'-O)-methyltransferase [Paracoccaceae bacterium]
MSETDESKLSQTATGQVADAGVASPPLLPGLWLVATPIGNIRDITLRALDVLAGADVLACEDTRRTRQLMDLHGIPLGHRRMVSYHDQNGTARRPQIMGWLEKGLSVAYATDAGTPLIADPGYRLVTEAREAGHAVHVLPGASSVLAALCVAGLPTDRFLFAGFLPPKSAQRRRALEELADVRATLVFLESPRRVATCLNDMAEVLGREREAVMARELTKRFEEVRSASLAELVAGLDPALPPKGEIVVVVGPPAPSAAPDEADLDAALTELLSEMPTKAAARVVADRLRLPRRDVYQRALALKEADDPAG